MLVKETNSERLATQELTNLKRVKTPVSYVMQDSTAPIKVCRNQLIYVKLDITARKTILTAHQHLSQKEVTALQENIATQVLLMPPNVSPGWLVPLQLVTPLQR